MTLASLRRKILGTPDFWTPSATAGIARCWQSLRIGADQGPIVRKDFPDVTAACSLLPRISIASLHADYRAFRKPPPERQIAVRDALSRRWLRQLGPSVAVNRWHTLCFSARSMGR
jgi:hypothetical protein